MSARPKRRASMPPEPARSTRSCPVTVTTRGCPRGWIRWFRAAVRQTIQHISELHGEVQPGGNVAIAFVQDAEMAHLNESWLQHEGTTDVLTFDLRDEPESNVDLDGQIIICSDTAGREAAERGRDWRLEALLYAVHGTLHLMGYDDQTSAQQRTIHRLEDEVLTRLGVGPVYHDVQTRSARHLQR